jgi:hypothetical protein
METQTTDASTKKKKQPKKISRPRRRMSVDPLVSDVIVGFNVNGLLPKSVQQALKRLRNRGTDRDSVLATALVSLFPYEILPALLTADGLDVKGDWRGIYIGLDSSLRMVNELASKLNTKESESGRVILWRLVLFELAVRIAAAQFASDPKNERQLRHDLWAADDGFKFFLGGLLKEQGVTMHRLVDVMVNEHLADVDVQKGQFDRWMYKGRKPHAKNIERFARGLASAAGKMDSSELVSVLRMRIHLFLGCRVAHGMICELVGAERARSLAVAFTKQVSATFRLLKRVAEKEHHGPNGAIPMDLWLDERRRLAREAAFFGIRAGTGGWSLLLATEDRDLAWLGWPPTSPLLFEPDEMSVAVMELNQPGSSDLRKEIVKLVRGLSLDDLCADASELELSVGRQPLGFLGLMDRVLKRRFPI